MDVSSCLLGCGELKQRFTEINLWINSGGAKSILHKDSPNTINCVVNGTKTWKLVEFKHNNLIYQAWEGPQEAGMIHPSIYLINWFTLSFIHSYHLSTVSLFYFLFVWRLWWLFPHQPRESRPGQVPKYLRHSQMVSYWNQCWWLSVFTITNVACCSFVWWSKFSRRIFIVSVQWKKYRKYRLCRLWRYCSE